MGTLAKIVSLIFEGKKHILVEKNLKKSHFTTCLFSKFTYSSNSLKFTKFTIFIKIHTKMFEK